MSVWPLRVLVFAVAFVLFVPVRWYVWGGRLKDSKWYFLDLTFGQLVARERAKTGPAIALWAAIIALLTWAST